MIVFPAIDLVAGQVVRLARGKREHMDVYSDDPAAQARSFAEAGASWVHVVDLSAAFGEDEAARAANDAAIRAICAVEGISVDVGGGVRDIARIEQLAELGCARIALGTALVRDRAFAEEAAARFGGLLVADIAARDGIVAVDGWRDSTGMDACELASELATMGFEHLVFTDVARDGMQIGIDVRAYRAISDAAGFPVVASGGVATLDDLRALSALGESAIEGVIIGRALYEGAFALDEALEVVGCSPSA